MFIINGFKKNIETIQTLEHSQKCMNCCNDVNHRILRYREYFTLFFVPIFPVSTKYTIFCPICTYERKLKKSDVIFYLNNKGKDMLAAAEIEKYVG